MRGRGSLVGRRAELARLEAALERAGGGEGSVVLLSGEAGVGKTRLAAELADGSGALVLHGGSSHGGTAPYAPVAAALRSRLRADPTALDGCGPLRVHLAPLLPELGPPRDGDRATLFEAVLAAFAHLARGRLLLVVLDDLQWSDEATLELLSALAAPLAGLRALVLAAYRSDGLARDHGLRRLRNELRRAGRLEEVSLAELEPAGTADLLAQRLGETPSPALARAVHDRTQGLPFFVEELAAALRLGGALVPGRRGLELAGGGEVPLPDTIREAVLLAASELSAGARAAAEVAAVAGEAFDLELVARLAGADALGELLQRDLVREDRTGRGRFRHALARDALYADVPWLRRRTLHRELAHALEAAGAQSREVAAHWLGAREHGRAREALLRAAAESEAVHAHRDAAAAGRRALELWPDRGDEERRADVLERYACSSELAGELAAAARAWSELGELRSTLGRTREAADAHRRLAAVHEIRGEREPAFAVRRRAAAGYAETGAHADAAVELLAMANQRRLAARHREARGLAAAARDGAERAGRPDLRARALGIEGLAQAKQGDYEGGLATVRGGLALALEHDRTAVTAELYQRLAVVLYDSADYRRAEETLDTALGLCRATGDEGVELACVTCLAYVLAERGEWARAEQLDREMIAAGTAVFVAEGLLGAIHCFQGKLGSARRLLTSSHAAAARLSHYNMSVLTVGGLGRVAAADGAADEARGHCRSLLALWAGSDDHHYSVGGLRWAAAFLAGRGDLDGAHACAEALTRMAADTGHPDALAALAHAIGETALARGEPDAAAEQLCSAVELHRTLDMPFERAEIELRAGVALAAAGEREPALERLADAYRTARKLGARPLAAEAAREVARLGDSVAHRLGARAAAALDGAGLSRRELDVVRRLAVGRTNREIAQELFLSQRTVDMHVRNVLRKLDCRSRVEAAHRAGELGLLA